MSLLKKITGGYTSSAKVVDGTLVLSMPDAISPVVWRMDFGQSKSSALEVREVEGTYKLMLKTPKGDISDVAPFDSKAKAVNALMAVSKAMEQGQGNIKPSYASATGETGSGSQVVTPAAAIPQAKKSGKGQVFAGIFGVCLLVGLLFMLISSSGNRAALQAGGASSQNPAGGESAQANTGVPMSADDFLRAR